MNIDKRVIINNNNNGLRGMGLLGHTLDNPIVGQGGFRTGFHTVSNCKLQYGTRRLIALIALTQHDYYYFLYINIDDDYYYLSPLSSAL